MAEYTLLMTKLCVHAVVFSTTEETISNFKQMRAAQVSMLPCVSNPRQAACRVGGMDHLW